MLLWERYETIAGEEGVWFVLHCAWACFPSDSYLYVVEMELPGRSNHECRNLPVHCQCDIRLLPGCCCATSETAVFLLEWQISELQFLWWWHQSHLGKKLLSSYRYVLQPSRIAVVACVMQCMCSCACLTDNCSEQPSFLVCYAAWNYYLIRKVRLRKTSVVFLFNANAVFCSFTVLLGFS